MTKKMESWLELENCKLWFFSPKNWMFYNLFVQNHTLEKEPQHPSLSYVQNLTFSNKSIMYFFKLDFSVWFLTCKLVFWPVLALKRSSSVISAPILYSSSVKFWKQFSKNSKFFYVSSRRRWIKARARWAAFGTELTNTGPPPWNFRICMTEYHATWFVSHPLPYT